MEAFMENGIKSVRMDDIAKRLKMSKRTLYELFADKEELLRECVLYRQATYQNSLEEIVRDSANVLEVILRCYTDSVELYHKTSKDFFEDIKMYPKIFNLITSQRKRSNTVVIRFLKQGVEQGLFRDDVNLEIVHALLHEQMETLMSSPLCQRFPFIKLYETIIFVYLRGIVTLKGLEELDEFIRKNSREKKKADPQKPV